MAVIQDPISNAAHVIELALTPIFLLSASAGLLNVFSTRLGRISDRIHVLDADNAAKPLERARLHLRARLLNLAVIAGSLAGALTCSAAITLFFGVLRDAGAATTLVALFGAALIATVAALVCFAAEVTLAARGVTQSRIIR